MSIPNEPFADRFYRGLLRILPFDFRSEFGDDMEATFRQQRVATAGRQDSMGIARMWWTTITDIVRMAPREHVSVLAHDTRFALRMMLKNRGYTLAAVLILGLGIGANTSIFSVVNSVLLRPLPYAHGNQLVILRQHATKAGVTDMPFSVSDINDYRQRNRSLSAVVEYHAMTFTLLGGTEPHRVRTGVVSAGFFQFLGVQPVLGRTFEPDDERAGAVPVLDLELRVLEEAGARRPQHHRQEVPDERSRPPGDRGPPGNTAVSQRERRLHDHHVVSVPHAPGVYRQSRLPA